MKTRNGFVSNSSSSSFVVAVKDIDENKYYFLNKTDVDNAIKFAKEIIGEFDQKEAEEMEEDIHKYDNDEWDFAMFNLDQRDEIMIKLIKDAEEAGTLVVLGYLMH